MSSPPPAPVSVSRGELLWLTLGVWVGGVCILTLLPVVFIPRLGMPLGMAASYLVFFLAWQPVQSITQRAIGMQAAVFRMLAFVASGAMIAYYVREGLLAAIRG